jgi:hypothetical protein
MASKKGRSKDGLNKSAYIRERPNKTPAQIVEEAKAQGITIPASLVYAVRSSAKAKSETVGGGAIKATGLTSLGGLEGAIRAIVRQELKAILSKL